MAVNANVVGEIEVKVGMDRTVPEEDQHQKYVMEVDNTYHGAVVGLNEKVVKNEDRHHHHRGYTLYCLDIREDIHSSASPTTFISGTIPYSFITMDMGAINTRCARDVPECIASSG